MTFDWGRLATVADADPLRVFFSAGLLGQARGWWGGPYTDDLAVRLSTLPALRRIA